MTQNLLPRRASAPRAALDQHAHAIAVLMNMMFVRHLVGVYRHFGGDLLAAIVLGEVAHHNLAPLINRAHTPHELSEALRALAGTRQPTFLPTNAFSIAQATGIPRETVRRKIASLMRRGWIEKDAAGNLFVTTSPGRAFAAFHHERVQDVLKTSQAIESLLHDRQPATVRPLKAARPQGRAPIG